MSIRSGFEDYSEIHGNKWYDASFKRVRKRKFTHTVFHPRPGLWNEDRTFLKPYRGQKYDPTKWELEEAAWGHEHCTVFGLTIE